MIIIEVKEAAIQYLAAEAHIDPETAEEILRDCFTLCNITEAAPTIDEAKIAPRLEALESED